MENLIGLGLTLTVGIFILIGSLIIVFTKNNQKIVNFSISLAFTVMIGLVFLELFPEAIEHLNNVIYVLGFAILGILLLKLLDYFIPHHEHNEKKKIYIILELYQVLL